MASIKENLIAARALIDTPEKWLKNHPGTESRRCTWGAVVAAAKYREATKDVCRVLSAHVSRSMFSPAHPEINVIRFNDLPSTTHADVMALFQRAIDAEEAKEARS